jgi:hypothetical protein
MESRGQARDISAMKYPPAPTRPPNLLPAGTKVVPQLGASPGDPPGADIRRGTYTDGHPRVGSSFSAKADKKRLRRQKKISEAQLNPVRNSVEALNPAGMSEAPRPQAGD